MSGAAPRSGSPGSAGAATTAAAAAGSAPTNSARSMSWSSRTGGWPRPRCSAPSRKPRGPSRPQFRHVTEGCRAPPIRHVTKLGGRPFRHVTKLMVQVSRRFPGPRPRCLLRCRGRPRCRRGRRGRKAGACCPPRRGRPRPCSAPTTTDSRTPSHGETVRADQLDGARHIAAAAAPHQPTTGRPVASRGPALRRRGYGGPGGSQAVRRPLSAASHPSPPRCPAHSTTEPPQSAARVPRKPPRDAAAV